jgi:putative PIN family toxin of toxin-antitoxin system
MRICLDTNVLLRLFGSTAPFAGIKHALLSGRLELAVSTEILLEYEEVVTRLSGAARWNQIAELFSLTDSLHGNLVQTVAHYRFRVFATDPDDNKFVDCAIASQSDFIVTEDRDFAVIDGAGYRPKAISPDDFIAKFL